ncbi:flagellar FliJ protein [Gammaproteobacteria bacterium]
MAKRSERLKSIQKVAEKREQEAAREMGKTRTHLNELEKRLSELITFREEYARNFLADGIKGMSVGKMHEYQNFITRIDQAIAFQRTTIEQAKNVYSHRQRIWRHLHGRVMAMEKLAIRYRQQEQALIDQREQKETDERAQRAKRIEL